MANRFNLRGGVLAREGTALEKRADFRVFRSGWRCLDSERVECLLVERSCYLEFLGKLKSPDCCTGHAARGTVHTGFVVSEGGKPRLGCAHHFLRLQRGSAKNEE